MEEHIVKIKNIEKITHDVYRIETSKPGNYTFTSGQATEMSINKPEWKEERRPFTFTNLPDQSTLEFTIKAYPDHKGVTNEITKLNIGDELIIHDVWGAISYKGEGLFIAGGAGITPFLSIFRYLKSTNELGNNKLIFANKTAEDIIQQDELAEMLGDRFINILSGEENAAYEHGYIHKNLIKKHLNEDLKFIYICGPQPMMDAVQGFLEELGVAKNAIVLEV